MNIFLSLIAASVAAPPPPDLDVPITYPSGDDYSKLCTKQDPATDKTQTKANYEPEKFAEREKLIVELMEEFRRIDQGKITLLSPFSRFS
jgi:hypothetical protein